MATKISSDVSSNVDITCRKGDSFSLTATITNSDGSIFDLDDYTNSEMIVTNSHDGTLRKFHKTAATDGGVDYYGTITYTALEGKVHINAVGEKMLIPEGTYKYVLKIAGVGGVHTILHGKFKVID